MSANDLFHIKSKSVTTTLSVESLRFSQIYFLAICLFYADWSPHYEWLEPVINAYEKRVVELVKVNIESDKAVADSYNIETVPAFVLLHRGKE